MSNALTFAVKFGIETECFLENTCVCTCSHTDVHKHIHVVLHVWSSKECSIAHSEPHSEPHCEEVCKIHVQCITMYVYSSSFVTPTCTYTYTCIPYVLLEFCHVPQPMSTKLRLELALQIATAVGYLADYGIVHPDLALRNCL